MKPKELDFTDLQFKALHIHIASLAERLKSEHQKAYLLYTQKN
jgi:hypothetical protein